MKEGDRLLQLLARKKLAQEVCYAFLCPEYKPDWFNWADFCRANKN